MVLFVANMYEFNLEGFIFSSVLLVVSIYMIIVGYKKGIKKVSAGNQFISVSFFFFSFFCVKCLNFWSILIKTMPIFKTPDFCNIQSRQ
jgi:hypothetical protein